MKAMHELRKAAAKDFLSSLRHTDSQIFVDMLWPDDECDDLGDEFGQRIDNEGRRVYHVMADL